MEENSIKIQHTIQNFVVFVPKWLKLNLFLLDDFVCVVVERSQFINLELKKNDSELNYTLNWLPISIPRMPFCE